MWGMQKVARDINHALLRFSRPRGRCGFSCLKGTCRRRRVRTNARQCERKPRALSTGTLCYKQEF